MSDSVNDMIKRLRRVCLEKPGAKTRPRFDHEYQVMDGFLDGFATFFLKESPSVVMLRCRDADRERLKPTHPGIQVSDRMKWTTEGWKWTDITIDNDMSEDILRLLIDESYKLACESLDQSKKTRLTLISRKLPLDELLTEFIKAYGMSRSSDEVLGLVRPSLLLVTKRADESQLALGKSRIGGRPDLPKAQAWPTFRDGKPLAFLAQINLAEIGEAKALPGLPARGMLTFFSVFGWQIPDDADPQLPDGEYAHDWTQVLYFDDDPATLIRHATPSNVNAFPPAQVEFAPDLSLPRHTREPAVAQLSWKKPKKDKYDELVDSIRAAAGFAMGYPPRNLLLGFADYEQDFVKEVASENLRLLFQLASDDNAKMCWGDAGFIYFFIRADDLERRDFGKIYTEHQGG